MRISDWSSDVCSSDLTVRAGDLFTSKEELKDARASLDDINGQLQLYGDIVAGLEGKSALSGLQQAELKSARDKITELQRQREALEKTVAQSERYVSTTATESKVSQRVRLIADAETRSGERRGGKEGGSTGESRWAA